MKNKKSLDLLWSVLLIIISVISLICMIVNIAGIDFSHTIRIVIAVIQIALVSVFIVATVFKLKNRKK